MKNIIKQKEFKQEIVEENREKDGKMKISTKKAVRRFIAIVLLILGGFYLLVAIGIIPAKVTFFGYYLDIKALAIIAIILIAVGLLLDDRWRNKIKNAFS